MRMSTRPQHCPAGDLKSRQGLRSTDGGEIVEELIQWVVPSEVIEHHIDWHPRPEEDRRAPDDLRVAVDDRLGTLFGRDR